MEHRAAQREITLRAPGEADRADATAVFEILRDRDLADLGIVDVTIDDVLDEWREVDPALDARVALRDGLIVGYGVLAGPGSRVAVSPRAQDDPGVIDALLDFTEQRERADSRERHRQWVAAADLTLQRRLHARGYEIARCYHRMTIQLDRADLAAPGDQPGDLVLDPLRATEDGPALYRVDRAAFGGRPDFVDEPLERFVAGHLEATALAPDLSRVARSAGQVVGFALTHRWSESSTGYVMLLAVDPGAQRRGIGSRLLSEVFAACRRDGLRHVSLSVASDNPEGRRLYRRLGMREGFRFDVLERRVGDVAPAG